MRQMTCLFVGNSNMLSHCLCPHCRHYMAVIPGVLESGAKTKMCMSVLKPNETLSVTVTLTSEGGNFSIHDATVNNADVHTCVEFQVNPP